MSIIVIHEMGHYIACRLLKWKTDVICIYPLGGILKLNEDINRSLKEELIIVISGPLVQILYYHLFLTSCSNDIKIFNFFLLVFNLLPVYPLDGGKIMNIVLSFFLPYRVSLNVSIIISFVVYIFEIFFFTMYYYSAFIYIVFFLILLKIIDENKKINYYFNKFLLERYLKKFNFKKIKYVNHVNKMYKERKHYFYVDNSIISEDKYLKTYFKAK